MAKWRFRRRTKEQDLMAVRPVRRTSKTIILLAEIALWVVVVTIAFVMQVLPFLLVLTLFNLAVGISSTTALVVIPIAVFGMLFMACWIASRRARNWARRYMPPEVYTNSYQTGERPAMALSPREQMLRRVQRWRWGA